MRKLDVVLDWGDASTPVGTLAHARNTSWFEYADEFRANPLPISPFKLPVQPGLLEHTDREYGSLFGVFDDSLPDSWGRLLMDREFRRRSLDTSAITPLDRLAYIGVRGMGALTYHPPTDTQADPLPVDLAEVHAAAERVLRGSSEDVIPALRLAGGSPGGARPKVLVAVGPGGEMVSGVANLPPGFEHYLIKFAAGDDHRDAGPVEVAYNAMAAEAGIHVPSSRLFTTPDGRWFGATRFDRAENHRLHMHTLGGLFHASHRVASMDYVGFLKATLLLTRDHRQQEEAYRRMVFNVAAHNRDDHVKNISYLMDRQGTWRLAPAYDLTFAEGPGRQHTMDVAGEADRPGDADLLRVADRCGIASGTAREIIQRVRAVVDGWPRFGDEAGVGRERIAAIRRILSTRAG